MFEPEKKRKKTGPVSEHACENQTIFRSGETNSQFIIPAYSNKLFCFQIPRDCCLLWQSTVKSEKVMGEPKATAH